VQRHGSQWPPISQEAARKLRSDVLGIGCRSAVSRREKLATGSQGIEDDIHGV
jgi:hypothetical protein